MGRVNTGSTFILYLVCISAFFASFNQNIYSPLIPLIKDSFHVSLTMVNLSVSIFILIAAIMQIALGSLIDIKGARFVLIPGIILIVVASIVCAITHHFAVFLIFRSLQAVGTAVIPLIAATTIGRLFQGSDRGSAMGTYQTLLSIAPAIAPVLGGWVGDQYSYHGVFWLLVGISVILLLANTLYFPRDKKPQKQNIGTKDIWNHYRIIFKSKLGNSILILSFLNFFIYFALLVYLPVLLTDHYHLSLKIVGMLYLPMTVSLIIGSIIFKYIQKVIPLQKLFTFNHLIIALSVVLFSFTSTSSLMSMSIILCVYGISIGVLTPLYATMMTNEFEHHRGSAMGVFNFIRYMGMAIGPVASGFLMARTNAAIVFAALGILFGILSILLLIWIRDRRRVNTIKNKTLN
ncbi:MFS transporter [Melghirimyces algeriensis]|uniref:Predicted arabinose efflux permease, MFS family n=1 Tax=Melghirimyces algeriensis TaxID=910412 RepID=A0A521CE20_9BACL|nr:MFS transporter [Melghirimyces algeriensis]SMO57668.1 Predicted arabinose efflux permease, MFS family [Melghirimyces algeriensis]